MSRGFGTSAFAELGSQNCPDATVAANPEYGMSTTKRKAAAPEDDAVTTARPIERWVAVLVVLTIAVLVVIGVLILSNATSDFVRGNPDDNPSSSSGPWGELELTPIVIAPPLERIAENSVDYSGDVAWHFPNIYLAELSALFKRIGLSRPLREKLVSMAVPAKSFPGLSIHPPRQFVLDLDPQDRAALYIALNRYPQNIDQRNQFSFCGSSPDRWFARSTVSPATRKLVEPLIYRRGEFMYFADLRNIEGSLTSPAERANLLKTLLSDVTFLVHLKVSADSDLEALVNYWGRGGRAHEVRPLLESLMRQPGEQTINIMHLLPPLARSRLYTYPAHPGSDRFARRRDCHWTSLNFFNAVSDDNFVKGTSVSDGFKKDMHHIDGDLQLGDIIEFVDSRKAPVHSAVYIAGDLFFHKCGAKSSSPWALTRRKDLDNYYPLHEKLEVVYYRRKGLQPASIVTP